MAKRPEDSAGGEARAKPSQRDARLKAALQANIARRKAHTRALPPRGADDTGPDAMLGRTEPDGSPPHFPQDPPGAPAPHDPSEKD